ncbi:MAG: hypothetical protein Q8876_06345 [Bacillota bacterium]|nr:hypothetical protein [Bacillota bacterium]
MDDLSGKISEILSDPDAMDQIKALSSMLLNGNDENGNHDSTESGEDFSKKSGTSSDSEFPFSPEIMEMIMKFLPLLSSLNKEDDNTRLLSALRPFLSGSRTQKIDEAKKMLMIIKVLPMLREQGLF